MLPNDRAQPAVPDKPGWSARVMRLVYRAPLLIKLALPAAALALWPLVLPFILGSAVIAVAKGRPGRQAAYAVATWIFPAAFFSQVPWARMIPLLILPFAVAWAACARQLARWYAPCRTTAWAMLWSVPAGLILLRSWPHRPFIGVVTAILLVLAVLGWRLAAVVQSIRMYGPEGAAQPARPATGQAELGTTGASSTANPAAYPGGRFVGHPGGPA